MKLFLGRLVLIAFILLAIFIGWSLAQLPGTPNGPAATTPETAAPAGPPAIENPPAPRAEAEGLETASVAPSPAVTAMADCAPRAFEAAAAANAASLDTLTWAPFRGRAEIGWRTYGPRIAEEITTDCAFDSAGFAQALSRYQADHRLTADGKLTPDTFQRMRNDWDMARPFQRAARKGCPPTTDPATLQPAARTERYGERAELVHPGALAAYRLMVADARAAGVARDPTLLSIFSAFRDPVANAERCAREGNCGGAARALCSAHSTGTALDLNLGHIPGGRPDSTEDNNRRWMSQTPLYRWLVRNGPRYGFVNYAFEPWHWEWAGAA